MRSSSETLSKLIGTIPAESGEKYKKCAESPKREASITTTPGGKARPTADGAGAIFDGVPRPKAWVVPVIEGSAGRKITWRTYGERKLPKSGKYEDADLGECKPEERRRTSCTSESRRVQHDAKDAPQTPPLHTNPV
jgi:hypothetical protein